MVLYGIMCLLLLQHTIFYCYNRNTQFENLRIWKLSWQTMALSIHHSSLNRFSIFQILQIANISQTTICDNRASGSAEIKRNGGKLFHDSNSQFAISRSRRNTQFENLECICSIVHVGFVWDFEALTFWNLETSKLRSQWFFIFK